MNVLRQTVAQDEVFRILQIGEKTMNYITASELENRIGSVGYANLCGVTGSAQEPLVSAIIGRAEAIIDAFAGARFSVPLPKKPLVTEWALNLAEYELYKRSVDPVPEKIRNAYKDTVGQCSDLAAGRLNIDDAIPASIPAGLRLSNANTEVKI